MTLDNIINSVKNNVKIAGTKVYNTASGMGAWAYSNRKRIKTAIIAALCATAGYAAVQAYNEYSMQGSVVDRGDCLDVPVSTFVDNPKLRDTAQDLFFPDLNSPDVSVIASNGTHLGEGVGALFNLGEYASVSIVPTNYLGKVHAYPLTMHDEDIEIGFELRISENFDDNFEDKVLEILHTCLGEGNLTSYKVSERTEIWEDIETLRKELDGEYDGVKVHICYNRNLNTTYPPYLGIWLKFDKDEVKRCLMLNNVIQGPSFLVEENIVNQDVLEDIIENLEFAEYQNLPCAKPENTERGELLKRLINCSIESPAARSIGQEPVLNNSNFYAWINENNKDNTLKDGFLQKVLELCKDYLSDKREYKKGEYVCENYAEEFEGVFNEARRVNENLVYADVNIICSSKHAYMAITTTDGNDIFISFVEPTWADAGGSFNALDSKHYITFPANGKVDQIIDDEEIKVIKMLGTTDIGSAISVNFNGLNIMMSKEEFLGTKREVESNGGSVFLSKKGKITFNV